MWTGSFRWKVQKRRRSLRDKISSKGVGDKKPHKRLSGKHWVISLPDPWDLLSLNKSETF